MIGRIGQDFVVQARDTPYNAPPNMPFYQNTMRQNMLTNPPMGSAKLSGMYNAINMPVIFANAGQVVRMRTVQGGAKNNSLTTIAFPNRMPYPVFGRK